MDSLGIKPNYAALGRKYEMDWRTVKKYHNGYQGKPATRNKGSKLDAYQAEIAYSHLTKDKVITMASMLDKMDPEVAKKAIEQFPEFAHTMKDILYDYKQTLDKTLEENGESVKSYYSSCDAIISPLQKELDKENLSFDEKKYIIDKMIEVNKMKGDKDSENKKFLATIAAVGVAAVGVVVGVLAATLGGNTKIEMNDDEELEWS